MTTTMTPAAIEDGAHLFEAKREKARQLRADAESTMQRARRLDHEARELRRELRKQEAQRQQQAQDEMLAKTDFMTRFDPAGLRDVMRQHILHPKRRCGPIRHIDHIDHILYAMLRGKPWDHGLCPNTRCLPTGDNALERLRHVCAHRLARHITRQLLKEHPAVIPNRMLHPHDASVSRHLERTIRETLDLQGYVDSRIQGSDKLCDDPSGHQGASQ